MYCPYCGKPIIIDDLMDQPAPDEINPDYKVVMEAWCKRKGISPLHMKSRDRGHIEEWARERGVDWCLEAIKATSEVYLGRCFVERDKHDEKYGKRRGAEGGHVTVKLNVCCEPDCPCQGIHQVGDKYYCEEHKPQAEG